MRERFQRATGRIKGRRGYNSLCVRTHSKGLLAPYALYLYQPIFHQFHNCPIHLQPLLIRKTKHIKNHTVQFKPVGRGALHLLQGELFRTDILVGVLGMVATALSAEGKAQFLKDGANGTVREVESCLITS